jgi:2-amino-4-hydroxy-6-hydroxymethyldihydropteridine diphosphokinase
VRTDNANSANVAIALGSNLGDRRAHLDWAIKRLSEFLTNLRASSLIETAPVGVPDEQPPYLNAVVVGETTLDPEALLERLMALEQERGRERRSFRAARTLDLDVILYDNQIIKAAEIEIPHPRFRDREFVLRPLAEVAADWVDPVTGKTVENLLQGIVNR